MLELLYVEFVLSISFFQCLFRHKKWYFFGMIWNYIKKKYLDKLNLFITCDVGRDMKVFVGVFVLKYFV